MLTARYQYILLSGIAIIIIAVYFLFDPMENSWMPQCVFHRVTGLRCMGCGSQRMLHSLLHGDFTGAWRANMFAVCCLPLLIFLLYVELSRERNPKLYKKIHSRGVIISAAAMLGVWLLVRNIIGV